MLEIKGIKTALITALLIQGIYVDCWAESRCYWTTS